MLPDMIVIVMHYKFNLKAKKKQHLGNIIINWISLSRHSEGLHVEHILPRPYSVFSFISSWIRSLTSLISRENPRDHSIAFKIEIKHYTSNSWWMIAVDLFDLIVVAFVHISLICARDATVSCMYDSPLSATAKWCKMYTPQIIIFVLIGTARIILRVGMFGCWMTFDHNMEYRFDIFQYNEIDHIYILVHVQIATIKNVVIIQPTASLTLNSLVSLCRTVPHPSRNLRISRTFTESYSVRIVLFSACLLLLLITWRLSRYTPLTFRNALAEYMRHNSLLEALFNISFAFYERSAHRELYVYTIRTNMRFCSIDGVCLGWFWHRILLFSIHMMAGCGGWCYASEI